MKINKLRNGGSDGGQDGCGLEDAKESIVEVIQSFMKGFFLSNVYCGTIK